MQIPLFQKWALSSTINHQYINNIFAFEVPPSQWELREEIFELYLLMIAPFLVDAPGYQDYPQGIFYQPETQHSTIPSNFISHILLRFLLWSNTWNTSLDGLKCLAIELLGVSLAQADYSTSLTTHLAEFSRQLFNSRRGLDRDIRQSLPKLASRVVEYFDVGNMCAYCSRRLISHVMTLLNIVVTYSMFTQRLQWSCKWSSWH